MYFLNSLLFTLFYYLKACFAILFSDFQFWNSISDYAFFGSNIESITLPDTVISIGKSSFSRCHELKSIAIPTSILSIGSDAFNDCWKLEKVYITDLVKWLNINFNWCSTPLSSLSHCGYGGASLYLNGKTVESLVIPNTMVEIKVYAVTAKQKR